MNEAREAVLGLCREFMGRLPPEVGLVRIYAFGSRVRGDYAPDSDLDLIVELGGVSADRKRAVRTLAWELSLECGFVVSTLVVSESDFERGVLGRCPFAQAVKREGLEIAA